MPFDQTIMNKDKLLRVCPVCRNTSGAELLHTQEFTLPDNHLLPEKYDVITCNRCGFVYADTSALQTDYDKYYAEMSKYDMNYTDCKSSLYIDRAAWISSFIRNRNDSIIDIGCGNGLLLRELKKLGLSDLTGVDPSEKCISDLTTQGIHGISSSIFSISINKKYDCSILSGVLEHIYDVPKLMETIKQLLKRHGLLFVCVPDASRYHNYDSIPFDYFNVEHINHFDETSLLNIGFYHGFTAISFLKTTITLAGTTQPMIFCVYANEEEPFSLWPSYSQNCIIKYIEHTKNIAGIKNTIDHLIETKEEIIIWGAGNFTSRMLACSGLDRCNIILIVDKDKHKQGTSIGGRRIYAPEAILSMSSTTTILVCAAVFSDDIIAEIKSMSINNKIIVLK